MDVDKVIALLQGKYPRKHIITNDKNNPTEIVCEIEPTSRHPQYSMAIFVIDKSIPHFHRKTKEKYKVLDGTLTLQKNGKSYILHKGDKITICPGEVHWAEGKETWVECYGEPGWTAEDHIVVDK